MDMSYYVNRDSCNVAALLVRGEPKVNIHDVALVFDANFLRAVKSLLQENLLESGSTARLNFAFYSAQVIPYEITADKRSHPTHTFP